MSNFQEVFDPKVFEIVSNVPSGQVITYAAIARKAGFPRHARMVSKALGRSDKHLPWHRVIKSDYTIGFPQNSSQYDKQIALLALEGTVLVNGKVIPFHEETEKNLDELIWGPE